MKSTTVARFASLTVLLGTIAATGGWGFVTFVGDSTTKRLDQDVVTACYGCHVAAKPSAYVFSKYRK